MRRAFFLACLLLACGGKAVIDGQGSSQNGGSSTNPCSDLDYCECLDDPACTPVTGDCFCPCCEAPGTCVTCVCGGGPYYGCAPSSCPGPFFIPGDSEQRILWDENGCPSIPED